MGHSEADGSSMGYTDDGIGVEKHAFDALGDISLREETSPEEWFMLTPAAVSPHVYGRPSAVPFLLGHPLLSPLPSGLQGMC